MTTHGNLASEVNRPSPTTTVAFLFPGLGDHYRGMGAGLRTAHPEFAETVDHCATVLRRDCGVDIRSVLAAQDTPAMMDLRAMLGRTTDAAREVGCEVAQPALFAVEYALTRVWDAWGVAPTLMAGYSLGEYVAATVSGVLELDDALRLLGYRAIELRTAPRGAMLAVAASSTDVENLLVDGVWVSGANTPRLTVVAGEPAAVAEVANRAKVRGFTARAVASSYAFHTPMMEPVTAALARVAGQMHTHAPQIPYLSNVTGAVMTEADALDPSYWCRHLCSPVQWGRSLAGIPEDHLMVEVGPGQSLSAMANEIRDASGVVASMRHPYQNEPDSVVLMRARDRVLSFGQETGTRAGAVCNAHMAGPTDAGDSMSNTIATVAGIWQRLLRRDALPPENVVFFDLGGNSLLASQLALRIRREFGSELTLRDVYEHPTVREQAALIRGEKAETGDRESRANLLTLPNGMVVSQQNEAETRHFYADIFEHRSYVQNGVRIDPGAIVVDVGGNIGLFSLFAHTEAPGVRLLTFEPAPPLVAHLRANLACHGAHATVFEMGLSDHEGSAQLTFYPRSSGMSTFVPDVEEEKKNLRAIIENQERLGMTESAELADMSEAFLDVRFAARIYEVPLRRLSDVLREQEVDRIDLLKVDVQKAEEEVFNGIDPEHWPLVRQVVAEVHDFQDGRVARLSVDLERLGFRVTVIQDDLYIGTDIYNLYATKEQ